AQHPSGGEAPKVAARRLRRRAPGCGARRVGEAALCGRRLPAAAFRRARAHGGGGARGCGAASRGREAARWAGRAWVPERSVCARHSELSSAGGRGWLVVLLYCLESVPKCGVVVWCGGCAKQHGARGLGARIADQGL
ncbi:UNVERIFIED_CONTAM: hypothetical protein K2H54_026413, partial [Gekko kuhli]